MSNRYRLDLVKLHCTHKQDAIGPDDPKIIVDGVTIYGPGDLGKGESVNLAPRSALFTNSTQVQLIEVDAGADDDMGTVTIVGSSSVNRGDQQREFHRTNADYELTFRVAAA
jgi:hypothetical protein